MSCWSIELSLTNAIIVAALYYAASFGFSFFKKWQTNKKLERWDDAGKNKVILHGVPRGLTVPSISPFVLKLETYLRMAKIPYEFDATDPWSTKGKTPWITFNGNHVADSQFSIEFLQKKFDKVPETYSKAEKAAARAFRILLETNFLWGLAKWRYVDGFQSITKILDVPYMQRIFYGMIISRGIKTGAWHHGIGRHSDEDVYRLTSDDLRSLSNFIGTKKFLLGDEPCEEDCSIFGMLCQVVWASPGSPFERLANGELSNLKAYCVRMKNKYWQDWDQCIQQ